MLVDILTSIPEPAWSILSCQGKFTIWWRQGIRGMDIHQALVDIYGHSTSYSSIRRFLPKRNGNYTDVTTV